MSKASPARSEASRARSPRSLRSPGKREELVRPRWDSVTSWPCSRAASTRARPKRRVHPPPVASCRASLAHPEDARAERSSSCALPYSWSRSMPTLHIGTAPHPVLGQPVVHFSGVEPYEVADLEVRDTPLSYKAPDVAYRVVQPLCQRLDVEELWDRPGPHSAGCPAAPVASRLYTPAQGLGSSVHVSSSAFDSSTFCLKGPHWR